MIPATEDLLKELTFKTSRSGGKGGQHVNKVSTKVELIFNISASALFTEEQKALLTTKLEGKLDTNGDLHVVCQEDRSQLSNKQKAITKLVALLIGAFKVQKKRKPTKVPKAVIKKRLDDKAARAGVKEGRKKPDLF